MLNPVKPTMTPRDFCYWLQGYFEISGADSLNEKNIEVIKNHLQLVFKKETPEVNPYNTISLATGCVVYDSDITC
jgi:hypothetical protein